MGLLELAYGAAFAATIGGLLFVLMKILAPVTARRLSTFLMTATPLRRLLPNPAPAGLFELGLMRVDRHAFTGSHDGIPLTIETAGGRVVRIQAGTIHPDIVLRRQGLAASVGKAVGGLQGGDGERSDYTIGAPSFDDHIIVRGPEALLRGALTATGRANIQAALSAGFSIERGAVFLESRIGIEGDVGFLAALATDAARTLTVTDIDVPKRLADQIRSEPEADVRLRCAQAALRLEDRSEVPAALRKAIHDEDWRISVLAAEALGAEGRPTLIEALEDDTAPDPPRLLAFEALVRSTAPGVYLPLLRARLGDISYDVRKRAQQAVGAAKDREAIPMLLDRVERAAGWEMASLAEAFGLLGDPAGLRPLRKFLSNSEAGPIAVKWLGEIGELEDVERLRAWIDEPSRSRSDAREAQASIARIQARHGGDAGGLALHDAPKEVGAVSIPDAEAGAVSLPPRPTKQST